MFSVTVHWVSFPSDLDTISYYVYLQVKVKEVWFVVRSRLVDGAIRHGVATLVIDTNLHLIFVSLQVEDPHRL